MIGKIIKLQLILVLLLTIMLSLAAPALAQPPTTALPAMPEQFWGSVTVNGSPVAQGTVVAIKVGGTQVAQVTTDSQGRYGYGTPLMVSGAPNAAVEFYVNGTKAAQTTTFSSGKTNAFNLTVGSGSTTPPTPTTPTTPAPTPPAPTTPAPTTPAPTPPATTPPAAAPSSAASFTTSNVSVSPAAVKPGEKVTVAVDVKNTGTAEGSYKVVLLVNGTAEAEQTVTLGAGKTQRVTFTTTRQNVGSYSAAIDGKISDFKVSAGDTSPATMPIWVYAAIGAGALLVVFLIILIIRRRSADYY